MTVLNHSALGRLQAVMLQMPPNTEPLRSAYGLADQACSVPGEGQEQGAGFVCPAGAHGAPREAMDCHGPGPGSRRTMGRLIQGRAGVVPGVGSRAGNHVAGMWRTPGMSDTFRTLPLPYPYK